MTVVLAGDLVTEIVDQVGFDVTEDNVLVWLDRRHKTMVRRARVRRALVDVGPTVAGQAFYVVDVVELLDLKVAGVPYTKALRSDVYANQQGQLCWTGKGTTGLIVEDVDPTTGDGGLTFIPTPTTSGDEIVAYAAIGADTLTLASPLLVGEEYHDALIEGASATGYARDSEQTNVADRNETRFDNKCEELRREIDKRYRGSGAQQIRIVGVNA